MPILFANPWGLLALLGLPVVLAVHFLHRHRKSIPVSTLFLIEIAREPAQSGRRLHKLLPSIPMWLQLLMVLLITALISRPYRPQGMLEVAIVVDESASMMAFRSRLADELGRLHKNVGQNGQKSRWHIYSANPSTPVIYSGDQPEVWFESLKRWQPSESWRNPDDSLRLARTKVGNEGVVIYATDTPSQNLPAGVAQLSIGSPIDNAGIAGVTTETGEDGTQWQAVIVNHSASPAVRQWSLSWNGTNTTPPQSITLEPHGMVTLEGEIPEDATRLILQLDPDIFPLDDLCPMVRETPKPLGMASLGEAPPSWMLQRLPLAVPRLTITAPAIADFALVGLGAGDEPPPIAGIHFSTEGKRNAPFINELATPSNHPLVEGLAWAGLAIQEVDAPKPQQGDEVLLWAGARPLISLRHSYAAPKPDAPTENPSPAPTTPAPGPQLILHFNPDLSNLERLPAGAILLLRYAEIIRSAKSATTWAQLDPGQSIRPLLQQQMGPNTTIEQLDIKGLALETKQLPRVAIAPSLPSFVRVRDEQTVFLEAAVAFTDSRESNFLYCVPMDTTEVAIQKAVRASIPTESALLPIICLSALAGLLTLYHFQQSSTRPSQADDFGATTPSPAA